MSRCFCEHAAVMRLSHLLASRGSCMMMCIDDTIADAPAALLAAPTPMGGMGRTSGPCTRARTSCPTTWWTALTTPPSTCGLTTGPALTSTLAGAVSSLLCRIPSPPHRLCCDAVALPAGPHHIEHQTCPSGHCWVTLQQDHGQKTERTGGMQEVAGCPPGRPVVPGQACGH